MLLWSYLFSGLDLKLVYRFIDLTKQVLEWYSHWRWRWRLQILHISFHVDFLTKELYDDNPKIYSNNKVLNLVIYLQD